TRTYEADIKMVAEIEEFMNSSSYSSSADETKDAAIKAKLFIGMLADYKLWKISKLQSEGLDPFDPDDMRTVIFDDFYANDNTEFRLLKYLPLKLGEPGDHEGLIRSFKSQEDQDHSPGEIQGKAQNKKTK